MKHILALTTIVALSLTGCQQDNKQLKEDIRKIVAEEIQKAGVGGRGNPQQPPQRRGPDPKAVYSVDVAGAPSVGPADAKITIVKGYEYACPFCEKVRPTIDEIQKKYGNDVRVVYKQYVVHPQSATIPALAVCAAHKQGKFKAMDEVMWEKGFKGGRKFAQEDIEGYAKEAGLNVGQLKTDMEACKPIIAKEQADLARVGVTGTPAFYINGRFIGGAQPLPAFEAVIAEELEKANKAISGGIPAASYYQQAVVEKGLKSMGDGAAPGARPAAIPVKPGAPVAVPVKP
ncbi:MAG: DsbA family protein [Myxococcales bacterium]|nr:DsbA family protein [Myxococcales bacterium]